jgi:hypothetical protein
VRASSTKNRVSFRPSTRASCPPIHRRLELTHPSCSHCLARVLHPFGKTLCSLSMRCIRRTSPRPGRKPHDGSVLSRQRNDAAMSCTGPSRSCGQCSACHLRVARWHYCTQVLFLLSRVLLHWADHRRSHKSHICHRGREPGAVPLHCGAGEGDPTADHHC